MKRNPPITSLISRLAEAESAFLRARFLAPVSNAGSVAVRIGGVICRMRVRPYDFAGWGVFQPTSYTFAKLVRAATLAERRRYLNIFPAVRLILIERTASTWIAISARAGDSRIDVDRPVVVHGVEDADVLETIVARCDGTQYWFDEADPQADPSIAAYLRESMVRMVDPRLVECAGLTADQRRAYALVHARKIAALIASGNACSEYRIRAALDHGGATMTAFAEVADSYRVTYAVGEHMHVSLVEKKDLSVQSAGICLDGEDEKFDLASLVSVLREGHATGELWSEWERPALGRIR